MNNIDILEEKIEKDYANMMKVINSTSLPLFVEDTIEDMHILIKTIIAENKELERQIKIKNAYLTLINDIAYDYDGCNTVESLKGLIDELVKMNTQALKNDDWTVMYTDLGQTKNKNILQELLDERNNTDK